MIVDLRPQRSEDHDLIQQVVDWQLAVLDAMKNKEHLVQV
jgi:hypothetical protein